MSFSSVLEPATVKLPAGGVWGSISQKCFSWRKKKQNKENTQTVWNETFRLHIQTLLYTSFSQKAQSKGSYFYLCSKNTRALVHSHLIGWGLIWFPTLRKKGKQSGDAVTVFGYTLSVVDCHLLFSAVCHDVRLSMISLAEIQSA